MKQIMFLWSPLPDFVLKTPEEDKNITELWGKRPQQLHDVMMWIRWEEKDEISLWGNNTQLAYVSARLYIGVLSQEW